MMSSPRPIDRLGIGVAPVKASDCWTVTAMVPEQLAVVGQLLQVEFATWFGSGVVLAVMQATSVAGSAVTYCPMIKVAVALAAMAPIVQMLVLWL